MSSPFRQIESIKVIKDLKLKKIKVYLNCWIFTSNYLRDDLEIIKPCIRVGNSLSSMIMQLIKLHHGNTKSMNFKFKRMNER